MAVFNAVLCVFRIQEFSPSGGRGGVEDPGPPDSKKLGPRCFVIFAVFLVLTFNLLNSFTEGTDPRVRWFIFWKTIIFQGSRGGPTFYGVGGGVQLFSRGGGGGRPNANFCRNLSKLWFPPDPLSPLCIRACSAFTCSSDPVIDLHLLVVWKLGGTGRSFLLYIRVRGGQWLSGRVLDSRPRGRGFDPHRRHCDVSLSKTH